MTTWHKLLQRQLKKLYGELERVPESVRPLLEFVDTTYQQADADRLLLERSLDLTSQELLQANTELRRDREALEARVAERTADLLRANASLERQVVERREAEDALRQSERRFQTLANNSPAGILHSDARGRCLYVNKKWCEMAGITQREALGSGWLNGLHPDDRDRVRREWRRAVSRRLPGFAAEFRFRRRDEQVFWVVAQAEAIRTETSGTAGYVLTATDITERRHAEEATRRSEERFRTLFEDSQDMIYVSSPEGRLLDVNPAGVALFGFESKRQFLRSPAGRCLPIREEDWRELTGRVEREGSAKDLELSATRSDGRELCLLATATPVRTEGGKIESLRGILRDVTEHRQLERQLLQAQKMEAVGRLAGGVAHDFNNLLTAIMGYAELLRLSIDDKQPGASYMREISQAAKRGARLTQQLLAFSRRQVLEPRVLDLNRVVADMESFLRRIIGEDIQLVTRLDLELGPVLADAGQLEQVLLNLAVNARDAMPDGGELTLQTSNVVIGGADRRRHPSLPPGAYSALVVADTGAGVPDEIRDQIFEPFFSTKEEGRGTGLGLSTVYGIVSQSGGAIELQSELSRGTRFEILLPQTLERPREADPAAAREELPRGTETILLAEDEPAVRAFLTRFLEKQGYQVIVAADGQQAYNRARDAQRPVDLLLSDVVMPKLNGLELAERMRATLPDLKVILMSGHTGSRSGRRQVEDADTAFLQKPFSTEELAVKVRQLLDRGEDAERAVVGA